MKSRFLCAILLSCFALTITRAQDVLSDYVEQAKADWMFGKWEAKTDKGDAVSLQVTWDLNKTVVVLHGKAGDLEFKGYSAIDPGSRDVRYVGYSNLGSISKGRWDVESDELVLRLDEVDKQGSSRKMAAVFVGSPSEGLQVRLHGIDSSGSLVTPARVVYKFKKQS